MKTNLLRAVLGGFSPLLAAALGAAETPAPEEVVQLPPFAVEGVPVDQSINPLTGSVTGLFGDAREILDTPRAVSLVTPALYRERAIDGLQELLPFSPGAYAPAQYGRATVPYMRGDVAETYLNGQRRSNNFYGYFPSFNGLEAAELVRGPGGAALGSGYASGGFINYLTKRPHFDASSGVATLRLGSWLPDAPSLSHANASTQVDWNQLVSSKLAWRLSVEGKGGDTLQRRQGVRDDRADCFFALTWVPDDSTTWEINAQVFWQDTPQTNGINRPTPDLFERGLYWAGPDSGAAQGTLSGVLDPTGPVSLPVDRVLFGTGDFSRAWVAHLQSILTQRTASGWTITHRDLLEAVDRARYHAFEYSEAARQATLEHRTELRRERDGRGGWPAGADTFGLALRGEWREGWVNYWNEFLYAHDLAGEDRTYAAALRFPGSYFPGRPGPGGRLVFGAADGLPESSRSTLWNPAAFWQHESRFGPHWSVLAGLRADGYWAHSADALPPEGQPAAEDSLSQVVLGGNLSLTWQPQRGLSFYATYNHANEINGTVTGGALPLVYDESGALVIDPQTFSTRSRLFELGAKAAAWDNRLFVGLAAFRQTRHRPSLGGGMDAVRVSGIEAEATYQPSPRLHLTAALTVQDGKYVDSAPWVLGGPSLYDSYAAGTGPGGRGTGLGYDFGFARRVPRGDWPLLGFSRVSASARASYRWDSGIGLALAARFQGPQEGNFLREYRIPAQYAADLSVFYREGDWEVNLDLLNLTDAVNWVHNGDAFTANSLVSREPPRRVEAWLKRRF